MKSEEDLRYRAWLETTRKRVDEQSRGRLGYVFLPASSNHGVIELQRQFYGQRKKEGLIIDVRWNGGGMGPNRFIEFFDRPLYFYDANDRTGGSPTFPEFAHFGRKCMLVNGASGSGGDNIAYLFRHQQLGKLIGTRSAGALVAGGGTPQFVDCSIRSVLNSRPFGKGGGDARWALVASKSFTNSPDCSVQLGIDAGVVRDGVRSNDNIRLHDGGKLNVAREGSLRAYRMGSRESRRLKFDTAQIANPLAEDFCGRPIAMTSARTFIE